MKKKARVIPHTSWAATSLWTVQYKTISILLFALSILGIGDGLIVLSGLGSTPWTVLSQGIAIQTNFDIGWSSFLISCAVMLVWKPLKLRLGLGTLLNIIIIALFLGITTKILMPPTALFSRMIFCLIGILLYGFGTALYLTCHLGAGPRDGLMVGICQRFHLRINVVRTSLEISVCLLGFLLGGVVGLGTVLFATSIGGVVQFFLNIIARLPHIPYEK
ncbi:YitT family protein [Haemophilus influenzae]|uniref:membrane protein YczE n=1 Tax=Haemophilus TaxID=724 RepID=UPI000680A8BA|nr:YitT family protein [Haemophilus influenzae]KMZ25085.1 membrane protein [Haemophilus influenzae]MCK8807103.1 YitT family protein [Haemophilus influenzae]MCK8883104.1 YitT family protein [Haemophilus influenzae]MCK9068277.1 YitT family protein [Haemophilus influenzae]MCK9153013.1 YitT family protein [Haemophilus influenzae]